MNSARMKTYELGIKEAKIGLILSFFGGMIGADAAYRGNYVLALIKLLTLGCLGIVFIVDIWMAAGLLKKRIEVYRDALIVEA
jgi:hypothetical protein